MTHTDRRGLVLSTASGLAAEQYRAGIECFLRGQPGAGDHFAAACSTDPGFLEAHVGGAFSALYAGDTDGAGRQLAAAERAGYDQRGRGQLALVRALSQLDVRRAERLGRHHLAEFPLDDVAREALGLVLFFVGRSDTIIDLYDWLAPRHGRDWGFAASWSFACHEVGRLAQSRELGQLALAARPDHVFATHSLAHVAYERGAHDDGADLVRAFFAAHDAIAFQRRHLRWHLTLNLLATGRQAEVPALWADTLAEPTARTSPGAVEDGAGLLWRWHLYGLSGWPLPWEELAEQARAVAALPVIPLPAASAAVVLAALGDEEGLAALVATAASMEDGGLAVPSVVLAAVATAARASFRGEWDVVAEALAGVQGRFAEIGGVRAQREVFEDALIMGLLRSGQVEQATGLLEDRLGRRPSARRRGPGRRGVTGNRWLESEVPRGSRYDQRFDDLAAAGHDMHGEATLVEAYGPGLVLDAGCGTGRVAIELDRRGHQVVGVDLDPEMLAMARTKAPHLTWAEADLADPTLDLGQAFDTVVLAGNVLIFVTPGTEGTVVAGLARHLRPGGRLIAGYSLQPGRLGLDQHDAFAAAAGLELEDRWSTWDRQAYAGTGPYAVSVHRRTD